MFIFQVIKKLGMPSPFIHMINLLFQGAIFSIEINNQVTKPFALHRDVRQGWRPLDPSCLLLLWNRWTMQLKMQSTLAL